MPHAASSPKSSPTPRRVDENEAPAHSPEIAAASPGPPLAECACVRTRHRHGDYISYKYHRCRCPECTDANTAYCRKGRAHRKRVEMVDPGPARARVRQLQASGLILDDIAHLCGLAPGGLDHLMYGNKGRPLTRIVATTMTALMAISYREILDYQPPGTRNVDSSSARLQVQALHAFGWTAKAIALRAGASPSAISMLLTGRAIREDLRLRIDAVYRELHGVEAPRTTRAERVGATMATLKAEANGWTTDAAYDAEYAMLRAA